MVANWALYDSLLGVGGEPADLRSVVIDDAISSFCDGIVNDPAYQSDAMVNDENTPIVASRTSTVKCSIKAIPDTNIHIGDMVECLGETWIVVELHRDKIGIINGEMWLCNKYLKFQNHSRVVNTRPCVIDDGTFSKKSSDPDAFVMANTYKVYMTIDSATERIYVDKRIGFGQIYSSNGEKILEVYKVIGIDLNSKNYGEGSHLMILTMQRDVYNPETDSIDDNICDIFNGDDNVPSSGSVTCIIDGKNNIRIGTTRKYIAKYADTNGTNLDDIDPSWTVVAPEGVAFYIDEDGKCAVSVPLDGSLVGESISIFVEDTNKLYGKFEKKVQVITVG